MSIDPRILKRMQGEDSFIQSQTRGSRRVRLNRGQNWVVRFLPARMGPDGLWFARIAQHWLNKLPIVCPRNTAEDFGGDPECECPVCVLAEELNESADEIISKFGFKSRANAQYLTYCIVWEKDGVQQPMTEILNPYEFRHYRSTFEELKGFYIAGGRKCADSVLDYQKGNDFSVNKTAKGLRLDKLDSSPIFDANEPKYAEWIKKLEAACKTPKVVIPTHDQLQAFAQKLQDAANRGGVPDEDAPRRGAPRRGAYEEDDEAQFRRGGRGRPAPEPEEEDDLPYDAPARPAARAAAPRRSAPEPEEDGGDEPAARPAPATRRPAPEPADDEGAETPAPRRPAPAAETAPPRRTAPAPVRRPEPAEDGDEPPAEEVDPQGEAQEQPAGRGPARRLEPTARRAAQPQGDPEDEDPLPEDDKDNVPPAEKVDAAPAEDAPPPVSRKGSQGADIKSRLRQMSR